jgi:hypothetical protein
MTNQAKSRFLSKQVLMKTVKIRTVQIRHTGAIDADRRTQGAREGFCLGRAGQSRTVHDGSHGRCLRGLQPYSEWVPVLT